MQPFVSCQLLLECGRIAGCGSIAGVREHCRVWEHHPIQYYYKRGSIVHLVLLAYTLLLASLERKRIVTPIPASLECGSIDIKVFTVSGDFPYSDRLYYFTWTIPNKSRYRSGRCSRSPAMLCTPNKLACKLQFMNQVDKMKYTFKNYKSMLLYCILKIHGPLEFRKCMVATGILRALAGKYVLVRFETRFVGLMLRRPIAENEQ